MKIAGIIFESLLKTGGYEIFTYNLFKTLAGRGHEVVLYLPARELRKRGDFYRTLPFSVRPMLPYTWFFHKHAPGLLQRHLAWLQHRHRYDVWQVMGAWPEGYASLRIPAPRVLRCYGEDVQLSEEIHYGVRRDPDVDRKVRRVLATMDRVVAMTPAMAALLRELGVTEEHIAPIPNGIDLARLSRPVDCAAERTKRDIDPADTVLLTVGRNHPKKGFDLIPELAARLRDAGKRFTWLVVGGETDKLLPAIRERDLEGMVRPLPPLGADTDAPPTARLELPVDGLLTLYGLSDLFVFPSRLEGFSRVIIEALAAGLPVVTTDAPGCGETFEHGRQGLISPVDDVEAMAANVSSFLDSPERLARFSAEAGAYAESFDWKCIARGYETQYRQLIES